MSRQVQPGTVRELFNAEESESLRVNLRLGNIGVEFNSQEENGFTKFLDALSLTGGLFSFIFQLFSYLYKFYQKHKLYESLINETFLFSKSVEEETDPRSRQFTKLTNTQKTQGRLRNPLFGAFTYVINFGFFQYLRVYLTKKLQKIFKFETDIDSRLQIFQKVKEQITQDMDLSHLIKRLYEIDKLKILLLNKDQLTLFNTVYNPIINLDKEQQLLFEQDNDNLMMSRIVADDPDPNSRKLYRTKKHDPHMQKRPSSRKPNHIKQIDFKSEFLRSNYVELNGKELLESYDRVK